MARLGACKPPQHQGITPAPRDHRARGAATRRAAPRVSACRMLSPTLGLNKLTAARSSHQQRCRYKLETSHGWQRGQDPNTSDGPVVSPLSCNMYSSKPNAAGQGADTLLIETPGGAPKESPEATCHRGLRFAPGFPLFLAL
jgi:hypothetical protein